MKLITSLLITIALAANFTACSAAKAVLPTSAVDPLVGEYQYSGFDDKGVKILTGRLTIISVESRLAGAETQVQIKGSWQLEEVVHRDHIGEQTGTGNLIGANIKGEIILDLNPNTSDANVVLRGKLEGKRLHGTWSFNGYAGPLTKGTFEAVKK